MNTGGYKPLNELQKKQVKKIAKGAAKRSQERKRVVGGGIYTSALLGNAYVLNPLYNISQGTGIGNRVGTTISVDSIKIKFDFAMVSTIWSDMVRCIVYLSDVESVTSGSTPTQVTNANIQSTLPLLGNTTLNQVSLQQFDWNQATSVYDKLWSFNSVTGNTPNFTKEININMKGRKFTYLGDTASYMEGKNLYVAFIVDNSVGTVNSTIQGNIAVSYLVSFRE